MRSAGLADLYNRDIFQMNGVAFDESDPPWWTVEILGWLGMGKVIQDSSWDGADGYRQLMELKLKTEPPSFLYDFYKTFVQFQKAALAARK